MTRRAYAGFGPHARLEERGFSFRHTAYGIPLQRAAEWQAKVILGTLLSSLGRYCLFMRAGRWGPWYDEVTQDEVLAVPIRLKEKNEVATTRIVAAVDALRSIESDQNSLFAAKSDGEGGVPQALRALDEGIYELFGLSTAQQDLVEDFHSAQRDFAEQRRRHPSSDGRVALQGRSKGLQSDIDTGLGAIAPYLRTFLSAWNRELVPNAELGWALHRSVSPPILCTVFTVRGSEESRADDTSEDEWVDVLSRLELATNRPISRELFVEGVVRGVTESQIVIAKRDERRLWTATAAREDVEATMLRVMAIQQST